MPQSDTVSVSDTWNLPPPSVRSGSSYYNVSAYAGMSSRYIWWKAWTPFSCFTL